MSSIEKTSLIFVQIRKKYITALTLFLIIFILSNQVATGQSGSVSKNANYDKSHSQKSEVVYRINCGSSETYTDENGKIWEADHSFSDSKIVTREKTLIIHNTKAPEIYRMERYGMENYHLSVKPGTYSIRLHFAETFDCNFQEGSRSIGVNINGKIIIEQFDPYTESGGFAIPVIIEYAGCIATDKIAIEFVKGSAINAIEIFKVLDGTEESIQQIKPVVKKEDIFIGERQKTIPNAKNLKILFIGNSMTFFWAIPESFKSMLEVGTNNIRIEPHRSVYGGKILEYHYNKTDAVELIKNGGFDFVVLQSGSGEPLEDPELLFEYAEKFNKIIKESGAKTLLYPSPMHLKNTDADRVEIMQLFVKLSKKINAPIIPACETLRLCYAEKPDVVWHNADGVHMGMHGGYAVASTFYAALTGGAPFPPPAILAQQVAIDKDLALFIQAKAKEAVTKYFKTEN